MGNWDGFSPLARAVIREALQDLGRNDSGEGRAWSDAADALRYSMPEPNAAERAAVNQLNEED